jgi:hypothetical protein
MPELEIAELELKETEPLEHGNFVLDERHLRWLRSSHRRHCS